MITSSRWSTSYQQCLACSFLLVLLCPTSSWGVNVGGKVSLADTANNQPTLRIQISGNLKPSTPTGGFDFRQWNSNIGINWVDADKEPPTYTEADGWGNFSFPLKTSVDPRQILGGTGGMTQMDPPSGILDEKSDANGSNGNQNMPFLRDLDLALNSSLSYRVSAGYDGFYSEQTLEPDTLLAARLALSLEFGINNFPSYIDFWKEGLDVERAGQQFERNTGNSVTGWEKYFGDGQAKPWLSTAWAPGGSIRNDFNRSENVQDFWIGSENNAVTNIAPAQGLYPHTWPNDEEASPLPIVYYRRANHE
jgi:hypothetical protein